jgi:hypothetical protein
VSVCGIYYICVLKLIHKKNMKTFKIEGTLTDIFLEQKQSKEGKSYDTGHVLLSSEGGVYKVDVWGKLAGRLKVDFKVLDVVELEFEIVSNEWKGRYFTNLKCVGIDLIKVASSPGYELIGDSGKAYEVQDSVIDFSDDDDGGELPF